MAFVAERGESFGESMRNFETFVNIHTKFEDFVKIHAKFDVFRFLPKADTKAVRTLLRTLVGMEDFARTTAHYERRATHPDLADDLFKRSCLYCLARHGINVLDSEWI